MATFKVTEAYLEDKIVKWAKSVGGLALKGATQFDTGYPDRIVYVPGAHAHIEVKGSSTRYHLSDKQMLWAGRVISSNTPYYIVENLEQIDELTKAIYKDNERERVPNRYCLNGFKLYLETNKDTGMYEVYVEEDKKHRVLFVGPLACCLPNTIYKVFKKIEALYPNMNYANL